MFKRLFCLLRYWLNSSYKPRSHFHVNYYILQTYSPPEPLWSFPIFNHACLRPHNNYKTKHVTFMQDTTVWYKDHPKSPWHYGKWIMLKVRVRWHGSRCKKLAKLWNFSFNQSSQPEERAKLARLLVHLETLLLFICIMPLNSYSRFVEGGSPK